MKCRYLLAFFIFLPAFINAANQAQPPLEKPQQTTPNTVAPQEDQTAAIVLQTWGNLAGNMVNIIKDPNNGANVAANVGQLFAGFATILSEIVKRDGKNNLGNVMAMLESPEAQEWLVKKITQNPT